MQWAYKNGLRKIYTMVSDYGPGIDAETWFTKGFKDAGGEIVGSVRMPIASPDFSAFVQRAKDVDPEAIFIFIPGGTQPAAMTKAMQERGIPASKILGQGEITMDDNALRSMGDSAVGIRTVFHYGWEHKSPMNEAFVKAYRAEFNRSPDVFSIGGWDGMHLIYEALKKTGGKADGDSLIAAAKGMKWESPRGPISIDPDTRDIVQTVYIREVEKDRRQGPKRRDRQDREREGSGKVAKNVAKSAAAGQLTPRARGRPALLCMEGDCPMNASICRGRPG